MMVAKRDEEEPAPASNDQDAPDWTTWLRSRLERVSSSERKAAGSVQEAPGEAVGDDEQRRKGTGPERGPAAPAPSPSPAPATGMPDPAPAPAPATGMPDPALPPAWVLPPTLGSTPGPSAEIEALRAAVTALVTGVGTLADTFSGFRSTVTERLDEYGETDRRLTSDTASELADYRKAHAGSTDEIGSAVAEISNRLQGLAGGMDDLATIRDELEEHRKVHAGSGDELADTVAEIGSTVAEIGSAVAEMSDRLQRLAGGMDDLANLRGDDERWAEVMGRLLDDVDAERQTGQREDSAPEEVVERLTGLEDALQRVASDVAGMASNQQRTAADVAEMASNQPRVAADMAELVLAQQGAAAADMAEMVVTQQGVAADMAEMVVAQQGAAADMAEMVSHQQRLVAEVAAVAVAQQGVAADLADLAAAEQSSEDSHRAPLQLDEAQVRLLVEAVLDATPGMRPSSANTSPPMAVDGPAEKPSSVPDRPRATARGRRAAPLRAERKNPSS